MKRCLILILALLLCFGACAEVAEPVDAPVSEVEVSLDNPAMGASVIKIITTELHDKRSQLYTIRQTLENEAAELRSMDLEALAKALDKIAADVADAVDKLGDLVELYGATEDQTIDYVESVGHTPYMFATIIENPTALREKADRLTQTAQTLRGEAEKLRSMTFVSKGEAIDQILASIKPLAKALDKVAADVEDVESETRKQADQMSQFLDDLKRALPDSLTLGVKESVTLPSDGVVYKAKSAKILTVKGGKLTGKKAGTTTVTATVAGTAAATIKVKVAKAPSKVTLSAKKATLCLGETRTLKATLPKGSASAITFTSSNSAVASVDAAGNVTALKAGTTTITARTFNKKKATCKVEVLNGSVPTTLSVDPELLLTVKGKAQLTPTVNPGAAAALTFTSKNKKIATVSSGGVVTGVKVGRTTITVMTHNGLTATISVNVVKKAVTPQKTQEPVKLDVEPMDLTYLLGQNIHTVGQKYGYQVLFGSIVYECIFTNGKYQGRVDLSAWGFGKEYIYDIGIVSRVLNTDTPEAFSLYGISPGMTVKQAETFLAAESLLQVTHQTNPNKSEWYVYLSADGHTRVSFNATSGKLDGIRVQNDMDYTWKS